MANTGAKLSSFPEVNDIQTGDMFPLLSGGNTNAKIDYATLADAIIAKLKNVVTKAQVGLGSVANLDQSKAIKSITRSGTTFTATALDGTTTTFTQQDNNTTYGLASQSSNGLMSAADKKAVDREFFRMLPKGGTVIPNGANLNSTAYLKVGNYYQSANVNTTNMTNIPFKAAFMMYVLSPLSEVYDNESTAQWVYRLRIFVIYHGNGIFVQTVSSGSTVGSFDYGPWVKMTNSNDLGAVSNTIDTHIANKSNPHGVTKAQVGLGSVVNLDQSKAIKSITRNGTTFTATALDGTTTTFTQQDSSTTYSVATSSADGLMSKTDKAKLDGISSGADASPIKTVKVNGTALTPDSNKAVNVTVPTLANNATTTAGGMALDARMGKTLSDQISSVKSDLTALQNALANNVPANSAWAHGRLNGTTVNLMFSHNVESITTSDGHTFYVKFSNPFPDEYYAAVASFEIGGFGQEIVGVYGYGTAGFSIDVQNASGNASNPSTISVIALR